MRDLIIKFSDFLRSIGINPIYFITIIAVPLYFIMYKNELRKWDKLNNAKKFFHTMNIIVVIISVTISLLMLIGVIKY